MATSVFISGKRQNLPGVYSSIKSGIRNPALALAFGNTLIIDVGGGVNYGGGAGINGTLNSGKDAIYTFDNSRDFRDFVGGGLYWLLAQPLFLPGGGATAGVSSLTYVRAKTTAPATITIPFGAQDESDSDGDPTTDSQVVVQVRAEGLVGNGALVGTSLLTRGFGAKVIAGVLDTAKFIVQFWRGSFRGLDTAISDGTPFDGIVEANTVPQLIVQSPELSTVTELVDWMNDVTGAGYIFNQHFKLQSSVIGINEGEIFAEDITNDTYELGEGGTESFSASDLTAALDALADQNWDFILADDFGDNARSTSNLSILEWITNTVKIKPDLYIGVGKTQGEFNSGVGSSVSVAQAYDSQYVTVVHGGAKIIDVGGRAFKEYDSIYKAAVMLGREAGLEPQIPLTFKGLGIQGEIHQLTNKEASIALDNGVLVSRIDNGSFEVIKGVNSLQNNDFLVNADGTTHDKQLRRIIRQLNKEIVVNAKQQLLKKPNGSNRNTVSPDDVKSWLEGYLSSKIATRQEDNLILSFSNIAVSINGDAYEITYAFIPNFSVSFLVFVGVIVDPNV